MKRKDIFFTIVTAALSLGIILVIIFKFVLAPVRSGDSFSFKEINKIDVSGINGKTIKFTDILDKNDSTYCFLFSLNDCISCIIKGIDDLRNLNRGGKSCIGLIIYDSIDEVKVWVTHFEDLSFWMIKRIDFYEYIKSAMTPVMVKIKNKEVESYRYIQIN